MSNAGNAVVAIKWVREHDHNSLSGYSIHPNLESAKQYTKERAVTRGVFDNAVPKEFYLAVAVGYTYDNMTSEWAKGRLGYWIGAHRDCVHPKLHGTKITKKRMEELNAKSV